MPCRVRAGQLVLIFVFVALLAFGVHTPKVDIAAHDQLHTLMLSETDCLILTVRVNRKFVPNPVIKRNFLLHLQFSPFKVWGGSPHPRQEPPRRHLPLVASRLLHKPHNERRDTHSAGNR